MSPREDGARVVVDGAVMGGAPCILGTRIPVRTLVGMLAEYDLDPGPILADFPQLDRADLRAAVTYAADALMRPDGDPPDSGPAAGVGG